MAGEVNFSGKLAKSIDLSAITVENLDENKKKEIEKIFDTVTGGNSANTLTTDELVVLSDADKNHDGKITDAEAKAAYDKLADNVKQGLSAKGVAQNDYVAYLKAMAKKNEELIAQENNVGNGYTVQLGEDLDDLLDRIVEANKIPEADKAAAKERYKAAIIAANKNNGAIKFDGNGNVKWLVAGAKIILPTMTQDGADKRVKDQNNKTAVENKYRAWRDGKIQSFRYSINADGQASEVRSSGSTNFDVTRDYNASTGEQEGVVASHDPADDGDVETLDMSKIVLIGKITEEDCVDDNNPDKKYDFAEVKAKAEKGLEILAKLNNPENIKSCTADTDNKYDNGQVQWYYIEFEDGSEVRLHMTKEGEIDGMVSADSDLMESAVIRVNKDGTLYIDMDDSNNVCDVKIQGAVKDFDKLVGLVKQSDKVREAMGLASKDFVNFDKIIDDEMPEGVSASDVKDKVKLANAVITKLENPSDVKEVKSENKDGGSKELTIKLKDDTIVKAEVDKEGKVTKVTVQYSDSSEPDATYDLKNGNITVKIGDQDVTTTGVIKNKDAIEKFVLSAKTSEGTSAEEESTKNSVYNEEYSKGLIIGHNIYYGTDKNKLTDQINNTTADNIFGVYAAIKNNIGDNKEGFYNLSRRVSLDIIAKLFTNLLSCAERYESVKQTEAYKQVKSDANLLKSADNLEKEKMIKVQEHFLALGKAIEDASKNDNVSMQNERVKDKANEKIDEIYQYQAIGEQIADEFATGGMTNALNKIDRNNVYYVLSSSYEKNKSKGFSGIFHYASIGNVKPEVIASVLDNLCSCADSFGLTNTTQYAKVKQWADLYYNNQIPQSNIKNAMAKQCDADVKELLKILKPKVDSAS